MHFSCKRHLYPPYCCYKIINISTLLWAMPAEQVNSVSSSTCSRSSATIKAPQANNLSRRLASLLVNQCLTFSLASLPTCAGKKSADISKNPWDMDKYKNKNITWKIILLKSQYKKNCNITLQKSMEWCTDVGVLISSTTISKQNMSSFYYLNTIN